MTEITDHGTGERGKWVFNQQGKIQKKPPKKKLTPLHAVFDDTRLDPIECMCGCDRLFDSMSAYKRHLKEGGWEITGEIPKGPETKRATERLNELVNESTMGEDWEKAEQLIKWGMMPRTNDERQELEAQAIEQKRQEEEWKKRNWHLK